MRNIKMKFKKYLPENLVEASILAQQMWEDEMTDIQVALENPELSDSERAKLEKRLSALEAKFSAQRAREKKRDDKLAAKAARKNESVEDMDKRCPECNTLLNDGGTCPKCDDGEEDYGDEDDKMSITESTSCCEVEKFGKWFVIKNSDGTYAENSDGTPKIFKSEKEATENITTTINEELSVREKLKKAYPELNFEDTPSPVTESVVSEELSNKEKLKRAFPELNFDSTESGVTEDYDTDVDEYDDDIDDDYYDLDDVEQDRVHAALYGGDRMYCDCGHKLVMDEWGGYCPNCEPEMSPKFN